VCERKREGERETGERASEREARKRQEWRAQSKRDRTKEIMCVCVCSKSFILSQTAPHLVVLFRKCIHHGVLVWVGNYCKTPYMIRSHL